MSGSSRQTGTVPKTKHASRQRRENPVNHIPNNLDWHEPFSAQRVRKESNTSASRMSDAGDDYDENPWIGLPIPSRSEGEEVRWPNAKSSNLTPERSSSLTNVDSILMGSRSSLQRPENSVIEESLPPSKEAEKIRLRQKIELSQRKIDELQQQQAAYLSLRNKAIQQVKPVQVEDIQQLQGHAPMRSKAVQQVKPTQQGDFDQINNIERRIHNMQEFTNLIQIMEQNDIAPANFEGVDCQMEQQLRRKLQELIEKKTRMDNLLAYFESNKGVLEAARSVSSEEGEPCGSYLRAHILESAEHNKRDGKLDNREQSSPFTPVREPRIEDLRMKLDQLQGWISKIENINGPKASPRVNGDGASAQLTDNPQAQAKLLHPSRDKAHSSKKLGVDHHQNMKRPKSTPSSRTNGFTLSQSNMECWSLPTQRSTPLNSVQFSSDEGEYDESPVKLCPPNLSSAYSNSQLDFSKSSFSGGLENSFAVPPSFSDKCSSIHSAGKGRDANRSECDGALDGARQAQNIAPGPSTAHSHQHLTGLPPPSPSLLPQPMPAIGDPTDATALMGLHLSQIQLQLEQMQAMYQGLVEKQTSQFQSQPWMPPPPANPATLGFMQYMNPSAQWHQHQLLITSLNQCCQLIWHQQREIAGLRQALNMVQEEDRGFKCEDGLYGHNLNPGLLWQPPLNNQVPPGNRANNYWDNFRSYSRQNLLSARNKSNESHRSSSQMDNLRRVENSSCSNTRPGHSTNDGNFCEPNRCIARDSMNKIKHEHGNDTFSLEQSVYSELESVIVEPERSPDLLLQLLSQLKSLKSQQGHQQERSAYNEANSLGVEPDCLGAVGGVQSSESKIPPPEDSKPTGDGSILDEVGRLISGIGGHEICSPDLLQRLVDLIARALRFGPHHETLAKVEASLLKFQGARLSQIHEEILCVIANILQYPNDIAQQDDCDEEGAVGGVIAPAIHLHHQTQTSSPQSVETELAEADQRSSTDNLQAMGNQEAGYNGEVESPDHASNQRDVNTTGESTVTESEGFF